MTYTIEVIISGFIFRVTERKRLGINTFKINDDFVNRFNIFLSYVLLSTTVYGFNYFSHQSFCIVPKILYSMMLGEIISFREQNFRFSDHFFQL